MRKRKFNAVKYLEDNNYHVEDCGVYIQITKKIMRLDPEFEITCACEAPTTPKIKVYTVRQNISKDVFNVMTQSDLWFIIKDIEDRLKKEYSTL